MYYSSQDIQGSRGTACGFWEYHKIDDLGFEIFRPLVMNRRKSAFVRSSNSDDNQVPKLKRRRLNDRGNLEEDSPSNPEIAILEELKPPRRLRKTRKKNFEPTDQGGDDYGPSSIHCNCDLNNISKCLVWHGYCSRDDHLIVSLDAKMRQFETQQSNECLDKID